MLMNPDTQHHVKEFLDDRLDSELTFTTKKLLFPMNNASSQERYFSGFHWSLLTYDIQSNEWVHYNSLNHGDKTVQKQCIKEVNTLVSLAFKLYSLHIHYNYFQQIFTKLKKCKNASKNIW